MVAHFLPIESKKSISKNWTRGYNSKIEDQVFIQRGIPTEKTIAAYRKQF
jgi:hypothetical protein